MIMFSSLKILFVKSMDWVFDYYLIYYFNNTVSVLN